MKSIYQALLELEQNSKSAALCTVVKTSGSTPRHSTSKMLVFPDSPIIGSVGGGELENQVVLEAKLVIKNKEACTLCMACVDASKGEVEVKGSETEFIVTIEPWGQLTATGMVEGLVDALHEQIDALSEEIKKLK